MNSSIFKTAVRNLSRNKFLTFLNITGLSAGLAVALLIFNYSFQEFRADSQHSKLRNIYVVMNNNSAHVHYEMASLIKDQIPGIKNITMVESGLKNEFVLKYKDNRAERGDVIIADSNLTRIFSFGVVSGNLESALTAPRSIILTESQSGRLFKDEDPIGKILSLRGTYDFLGQSDVEVKAVIRDLPVNSNLQFRAVVSRQTEDIMMPWIKDCIWSCSNVQNYVLLENEVNPDALASQMNKVLKPLVPEKIDCKFSLLPYRDVYFSNIRDDFKHGSLKTIYTIGSIAILILVIAVINYINLSIAGLVKRKTEVGIRKIFGVNSFELVIQFLGESVAISFIAMIFGAFIAFIATPSINSLSAIHLPEIPLSSVSFWMILIIGSVATGIVAGLLPALSLNRFKSISLIADRAENISHGINLKRALIVFQFFISIILIICTITVTRQLSFLRNANMGFNTENIINIRLSPEIKYAVFKNKLQHIPGVESISFSRWFPGNIQENWQSTLVVGGTEKKVDFAAENADASYVNLMGLEIIEGRNFSDSLKSDIGCSILNEAAVKSFGLDDPLEAGFKDGGRIFKIVGVIKDFNFQSLHNQIRPLVIFDADQQLFSVNVKLLSGGFNSVSLALNSIRESWNEVSPDYPFEYKFLDQEVENLYRSEIITEKIFRYGSFFAIFISCLGLFGLVLSSTGQKKKEIGIRKVNGARIGEVMFMLNRDFFRWVLLAFLLSCPVALYLMRRWLEIFAYKISISWWIFALAGAFAIGITMVTVSWQSWKAASGNPVEALRHE